MKILYYHQHFSTPNGSTGTRSYEFAKKLLEKGHTVTMICGSYWIADTGLSGSFNKGKRCGFVDGINVIEFDLNYSNADNFMKRSLIFLQYSWRGIKMALEKDYDILFATSTPLTAGIPGIFAKVFRKKPFIFEVRDLWPELPKAMGVITNPIVLKLMGILETLSYKFSSACIGLSPGIVKGIKKKVPHKHTILIPNGCDMDLIQLNEDKIKNEKYTAIFTGAHGFANGLDAVLDAAKILIQKKETDIEIQFIGDGILKPKLELRVINEGIKNCTFEPPMPKRELFLHLKKHADIGLMILDNIPEFYYGTSPNKFFDYIALGIPVFINYPGWLADLIEKNNCGVVVEPNNPVEFANALIKMKNKSILNQKGRNAKKLAESNFDRKNLSIKFVKYLENTIQI